MALDLESVYIFETVAVKCLIFVDGSRLKTCGHSERLGRGSRFKILTDAEIAPKSVEVSGLIFIRHDEQVRVSQITVRGLVVGVQLGHSLEGSQVRRLIEVKKGSARHREDLSAVDVHDNTGRVVAPVSRMFEVVVLVLVLLQILLDDTLNIGVQGQNEIISVFCLDQGPLHTQGLVQIAVFSSDDAVERVVIILLQAPCSHISGSRKADDIAGQVPMGIDPGVSALKPDPLDIVISSLGRIDLIFLFLLDPGGDLIQIILPVLVGQVLKRYIILRRRMVRYIFPDPAPVDPQSFQGIKRRLQISVLFQDLLGVDDHVIDKLAVRQHSALAIHDLPAFIGNGLVFIGLL